MTIKLLKVGAFAFLFAFAFAANSVQQTLPIPPPSAYADTESEANVAVTNGPSLGRRVQLILQFRKRARDAAVTVGDDERLLAEFRGLDARLRERADAEDDLDWILIGKEFIF